MLSKKSILKTIGLVSLPLVFAACDRSNIDEGVAENFAKTLISSTGRPDTLVGKYQIITDSNDRQLGVIFVKSVHDNVDIVDGRAQPQKCIEYTKFNSVYNGGETFGEESKLTTCIPVVRETIGAKDTCTP